MILKLSLIVSIVTFLICAFSFLLMNGNAVHADRKKAFFERLPRSRVLGSVLASIALIWTIPNIRPIFEQNSSVQQMVLPFIIVSIVLVCVFLDYLFARAIAAIFILGAHSLLKFGYPEAGMGYPVFATLILSIGVIGIILAAKPYWLRNWFRLSFTKPVIRYLSAAYFIMNALFSAVFLMDILL